MLPTDEEVNERAHKYASEIIAAATTGKYAETDFLAGALWMRSLAEKELAGKEK